jgi:hypothetical protein
MALCYHPLEVNMLLFAKENLEKLPAILHKFPLMYASIIFFIIDFINQFAVPTEV